MTKFAFLLVIMGVGFIVGCSGEPEDKVKQIEKRGAIETTIETSHIEGGLDVVTITNNYWRQNELLKTTTFTDTILSLEDTLVEVPSGVKDGNGDDIFTKQNIAKDYEIYITVK